MKSNLLHQLCIPFLVFSIMFFSSCVDLSLNSNNLTTEEVNNFHVVKAGLQNTTKTEYYEYICSEDTNHLTISGPVNDGLVGFTITDDQGDIIFNQKLSGFTVFDETIVGTSGIWTIKLDYQKADGSIDLQLSSY
ncbi:hypothetical protein [Parvicella tangerina]|uniref:Uncharacterized protein n=1 Tax=Parvicella tangerina TaxID=2829795 RepID=A0A916JMF6_9FLAO|nr:hypothetical protein [Parvicella tangerina]CAG5082952.1 hypothetical protein CRYO30217_02051 [Parvicella tangerina]